MHLQRAAGRLGAQKIAVSRPSAIKATAASPSSGAGLSFGSFDAEETAAAEAVAKKAAAAEEATRKAQEQKDAAMARKLQQQMDSEAGGDSGSSFSQRMQAAYDQSQGGGGASETGSSRSTRSAAKKAGDVPFWERHKADAEAGVIPRDRAASSKQDDDAAAQLSSRFSKAKGISSDQLFSTDDVSSDDT